MEQLLERLWVRHQQQCGDKTLLLVDETEGEATHKWFLNNSRFVVLDADLLAKKKLIQKRHVSAILSEARHSLIYAIKHGKTLVVRMSDSKTDFRGVFCDECCAEREEESKYPPYQPLSFLPIQFLLQGGAAMITQHYLDRLFHREDKGDLPLVEANKSNFSVIITSTIPTSKIEMQLLNGSFGLPGTVDDYDIQAVNY